MKVEISKTEIKITVPIAPRPSSTGKSILLASIAGTESKPAGVVYDGKQVQIGLNVYVKK